MSASQRTITQLTELLGERSREGDARNGEGSAAGSNRPSWRRSRSSTSSPTPRSRISPASSSGSGSRCAKRDRGEGRGGRLRGRPALGCRRQPAALPGRRRPSQAAERGAGGHPREEDRARRPDREAADDRVEPAPRRLDREALPRARRAVPRSDPGRHARPEPRRREVRLAAGLQVLDLRHLVDPPVGTTRGRQPRAHDPHPGARRRAPTEAVARGAAARGRVRPRADQGRARGGDRPADPAGRGGPVGRVRVGLAQPDSRRRRRRGARRPA